MAKSRLKTRTAKGGLVCPVCQVDMGARQKSKYGEFDGWKSGPVLHCEGSQLAWNCSRYNSHHGKRRYRCPECKGSLGCDRCTSTFASSVLCKKCNMFADGSRVAGTPQKNLQMSKEIVGSLTGTT